MVRHLSARRQRQLQRVVELLPVLSERRGHRQRHRSGACSCGGSAKPSSATASRKACRPSVHASGGKLTVRIQANAPAALKAGSEMLHYDAGAGYVATPLQSLGGGLYQGLLPPLSCGQTVDFYFSAETTGNITWTSPDDAPAVTWNTTTTCPPGPRDLLRRQAQLLRHAALDLLERHPQCQCRQRFPGQRLRHQGPEVRAPALHRFRSGQQPLLGRRAVPGHDAAAALGRRSGLCRHARSVRRRAGHRHERRSRPAPWAATPWLPCSCKARRSTPSSGRATRPPTALS